MEAVIQSVIEHGGLAGAILVAAAFYIVRRDRQLNTVQEKRVADAQAVSGSILDLVEGQNEVKARLVEAIDKNTAATRELREEVMRRVVG